MTHDAAQECRATVRQYLRRMVRVRLRGEAVIYVICAAIVLLSLYSNASRGGYGQAWSWARVIPHLGTRIYWDAGFLLGMAWIFLYNLLRSPASLAPFEDLRLCVSQQDYTHQVRRYAITELLRVAAMLFVVHFCYAVLLQMLLVDVSNHSAFHYRRALDVVSVVDYVARVYTSAMAASLLVCAAMVSRLIRRAPSEWRTLSGFVLLALLFLATGLYCWSGFSLEFPTRARQTFDYWQYSDSRFAGSFALEITSLRGAMATAPVHMITIVIVGLLTWCVFLRYIQVLSVASRPRILRAG